MSRYKSSTIVKTLKKVFFFSSIQTFTMNLWVILTVSCVHCLNLQHYLTSKVDKNVLVQCIVNGERKFATEYTTILISVALTEQDMSDQSVLTSSILLIQQMSSLRKWSLIVANLTKGSIVTRADKINNYIIYFRHSGEFQATMDQLRSDDVLNPHAKFLIVTTTHFHNPTAIVQEIFEVLRMYEVLNAVLLIPDSKRIFNLFGMIPFNDNSCNYHVENNGVLIDYCSNGTFELGAKWYNYKIPDVFTSCNLKVVYTEVSPYVINMEGVNKLDGKSFTEHGLEIGVLTNTFAYMNVSLEFIESDSVGNVFSNKTSSGALKMLQEKQVHIAIGGYGLTLERVDLFDNSFGYITESLVWVVPHEHIAIFELISLASVIKLDVWLVIILLTGTTSLIIILIAKHNPTERDLYKNPTNAVLTMLLTYFNLTVGSLPKTHEVRTIFSMILLFALVFNAAYTTFLISVLAPQGQYREKYGNVTDIRKYNLAIARAPNTERYFKTNVSSYDEIIEKSTVCQINLETYCFDEVAFSRNSALLIPLSVAKYKGSKYRSSTRAHLLRSLPLPVVSYQVNFFMIKGFWGFERINKLLMKAVEAGLTSKWMNIPENSEVNNTLMENPKLDKEKNTLDYSDFQFIFCLIAVFYLISTLVFISEILIFKYYKLDKQILF